MLWSDHAKVLQVCSSALRVLLEEVQVANWSGAGTTSAPPTFLIHQVDSGQFYQSVRRATT